ncbi:MAG: DUF2914 domain-containing protein, partial [Bdellovibrionia bacterium]
IDELRTILLQTTYLIIVGVLVSLQLIELTRKIRPPKFLRRAWGYRELLLNFTFGTLLNSYTIFYFKSASAFSSLIFIGILVVLLIINEFKTFGKSKVQVRMAFFSLCLISFLVSLAPTLMGFMGPVPFMTATFMSIAVISGLYRILKTLLAAKPTLLRTHVLFPYSVVQFIFVVLYFMHAIPPVPLSVSYMGIYHNIEAKQGGYHLSYTRPWWKFWQHGDQTFQARAGDSIFCYVQVFSPTRFKDQIQIRWLLWNEKSGWIPSKAIPMPVLGGRDDGYRGITKKDDYQPGTWRVQIETMDSQEIGRIGFTVEPDGSTGDRDLRTVIR